AGRRLKTSARCSSSKRLEPTRVALTRCAIARRDAALVLDVRRCAVADQPCQLRGIEFLLDPIVQGGPARLWIDNVYVRASLGEKLGSLESLPGPCGEKRRHAGDDVDLRAGFDK